MSCKDWLRNSWLIYSSGKVSSDFTFITVPDGVKVDIVLVVADEEEAEPGVKGVDGHDEEDADDVALFIRCGV